MAGKARKSNGHRSSSSSSSSSSSNGKRVVTPRRSWGRLVVYCGAAVGASLWWRVDKKQEKSATESVRDLLAKGETEAALEAAQSALDGEREWSEMHFLKGRALMALEPSRCAGGTCRQHAAAAFADALRTAPPGPATEEATAWLVDATTDLRGIDGTSPERVAALFDDYAETFDDHLVHELGYSAPAIIADAVAAYEKQRGRALDRILDVGCGTGLVARELRRRGIAAELEGVDLSPKMVARSATHYDGVRVCDARRLSVDCAVTPRPDLVVFGDVLVYLDDRDVERVLREVKALEVDLVALTVERPALDTERRLVDAGRDWRCVLGSSGRYSHNLYWLADFMLAQLRYEVHWIGELCDGCPYPPLRYERAIPVRGAVVLFRRRR